MREAVFIEIREGTRYVSFYNNGRWIHGARKVYLLDCLRELQDRYAEYGIEVFYEFGGDEDDQTVQKYLRGRENSR